MTKIDVSRVSAQVRSRAERLAQQSQPAVFDVAGIEVRGQAIRARFSSTIDGHTPVAELLIEGTSGLFGRAIRPKSEKIYVPIVTNKDGYYGYVQFKDVAPEVVGKAQMSDPEAMAELTQLAMNYYKKRLKDNEVDTFGVFLTQKNDEAIEARANSLFLVTPNGQTIPYRSEGFTQVLTGVRQLYVPIVNGEPKTPTQQIRSAHGSLVGIIAPHFNTLPDFPNKPHVVVPTLEQLLA